MKTLRGMIMSAKMGVRVGLFAFGLVLLGSVNIAQAGPGEMGMGMPMGNSGSADKPMNDELIELRTKVARLEAALEKNHRGNNSDQKNMPMGMGGKGKGMDMKMKGMDGMKKAGDSDQMDMANGSGMMGMDMMKMMGMMHGSGGMMGGGMDMMNMGFGDMPKSALPGFPGISHIYHIGATGFFLDHTEHLSLKPEQKTELEGVKGKSDAAQKDYMTKIEQVEKAIWELTGSDQPKIEAITEKVKEVESLNADKRIAFIKAVGEAASLLTKEQREALVSGDSSSDAHADHVH